MPRRPRHRRHPVAPGARTPGTGAEGRDGDRAEGHGGAPSPLAAALLAIGDRWTLLLVEALLQGPQRFGDLQDEVPGIAPTILSQRLRQLEEQSLVLATPYSERPPRFVYELTAAARELEPALRLLADWGVRNRDAEPARHVACGTPLEATLWCPTCEEPVSAEDSEELDWA